MPIFAPHRRPTAPHPAGALLAVKRGLRQPTACDRARTRPARVVFQFSPDHRASQAPCARSAHIAPPRRAASRKPAIADRTPAQEPQPRPDRACAGQTTGRATRNPHRQTKPPPTAAPAPRNAATGDHGQAQRLRPRPGQPRLTFQCAPFFASPAAQFASPWPTQATPMRRQAGCSAPSFRHGPEFEKDGRVFRFLPRA